MGIYIKNMEMPEECRECPFETYYFHCGETRCRATLKTLATDFNSIPFDGRADDCPLIEIYTPHGRLIDADALKWNFIRIRDDGIKEYSQYGIDRAPTIIPAEPCNDLAKPNSTIFAVQNADEDEGLFAAKPIDYMHTPSVEEIIEADGE